VIPARLNLIGNESSPVNGVDLQKLQQAAGSPKPTDMHRAIASSDVEGSRDVGLHLFKAAALGFPVQEVGI
jgi:hypothetical protein